MSYQKCPVCDGRGYSAGTTCTVCDGKKIISTLTGRSPKFTEESSGGVKLKQEFMKQLQDVPADIKKIVDDNFNELI